MTEQGVPAPKTPRNTQPNMTIPESEGQISDPKSLSEVYRGSLVEILRQNTGVYVRCEFLIGTQGMVMKEGILYDVGINFLTLFNPTERYYTVCDLYSLKFTNFYDLTDPARKVNAYTGTQSNSLNPPTPGMSANQGMLPNHGMAPNGGLASGVNCRMMTNG